MSCPTCGGRGHDCIDDLCVGGECIHGDSCPTCFGDSDWDDDAEYDDEDDADERLDREREEGG